MTKDQPGFLGMDVSKGTCDFLLLDAGKQILEQGFALDDCRQGREMLAKLIDQWFSGGLTHLYCGVESTGGYENSWFHFLCSLSARYARQGHTLKVARINPKAIKAYAEAGLLRTRTDQTSAASIAGYLTSWPEKVRYSPHDEQTEDSRWLAARQQVGFIRMLHKQKTQLSNQLEKLLYQHIGELLVYCRHGIPGWLLRLLARYPSRSHMAKAGRKKLAAIKGISPDKAASILARLDHQPPEPSPMSCHTIKATAVQLGHLQSQIDAEEDYLVSRYKDHSDVRLLATIKGVGMPSAVKLVVQIEDIHRFADAKKLGAYFGVHPTWKQSGDGVWKIGMSKQGRSEVRSTLFMCSLSGIRCNDHLKKIYHNFRSKGMNHYQAMGVVMHKLLRIVYGILNSKTPYDPEIDRKNREHAEKNRTAHKQKKSQAAQNKQSRRQRFMEKGTNSIDAVPLSRRAYQKRKQEASPSSLTEEYTGLPPAD